jgi:hypothetical protein
LAHFPYHRLSSDYHFQLLVWDVCKWLLGDGVEGFAKGKDGGRDGRFRGKANRFPSSADPYSGNFIIQDKWTQTESSTFAESGFRRQLLDEEVPKALRLLEQGELDYWLIFSNRRKAAESATELRDLLQKEVGCKVVHLTGAEELDAFLRDLPHVVKKHDLEGLLLPFRLEPQELREVIETVYRCRSEAMQRASSRWDYADYVGIDRKNEINVVTERYFNASIRDQSEPYFAAIKSFLENPRNFQRFNTFDLVFEQLCEEIWSMSPDEQQPGRKRVLRILLHYMYANCDLGEKPNDTTRKAP